MDVLRQRQIEALTELYSYNKKMLEALPSLVWELDDNMQSNTLSYLNSFLEGLNWEIQVTNRCLNYINEDKIRLNKKQVSNTMDQLNRTILADEYIGVAEVLQNGVEAYLKDMQEIAKELI